MSKLPKHIAQYKIQYKIGEGHFGTVYAARDPNLQKDVILKTLRADWLAQANVLQRLEYEANVLSRLSHPNVVKVSTFDLRHSPPYLVMEKVVGQTLAARLTEKGSYPLAEALPLLRQIGTGLDVAHGNQLIHHHLSPATIFITDHGRVKLVDFDLIKRNSSVVMNGMGKQVHVGDANYIAPEQTEIAQQHEITASTDMYAFGVIAYKMLTGRLPFEGSPTAVMIAHQAALPPNPRVFNSNLLPPVANVLMKALSKQPRIRYATANEFIKALEEAATKDNPTRVFTKAERQQNNGKQKQPSGKPTPQRVAAVNMQKRIFNSASLSASLPSSSRPLPSAASEAGTKVLHLPGSTGPSHYGSHHGSHYGSDDDALASDNSSKKRCKKWIIGLAILLILLALGGASATWLLTAGQSSTSEPEQVIPTLPDAQVLSEEGLYMRVGPGIEYEIVSMYPTNTTLRIVGRDLESSWLQVEAPDGQLGWMYAPLLSINISLDTVPFAPPPPAPLRRQL